MRAQHRRLAHADRRPVAVVTDSSADLADSVLDRHHIAIVPLQVVFGNETFRDRDRAEAGGVLPPAAHRAGPADDVAADARRVRPRAARRAQRGRRSRRGAAVGRRSRARFDVGAGRGPGRRDLERPPGGQPVRLARGGDAGPPGRGAGRVGVAGRRIAAELERVRGQSGMLLTVDRYDNLLRSGRVSRGKAWIAGMLDVKPILSLDERGRVVPVDRVRGREQLVPRVLALLEQRLTPRPARGAVRRGPRGGARGGRAGADRAGRRVPPAGLFRHPGHGRARHPRRARAPGRSSTR